MLTCLAVSGASWVTRHCHSLPGRWRLLRWLDEREAAFARLTTKTVSIGAGLRMCVDPGDENGRWVYVHGLERGERITRQFVRLLRPGDHAIDVGANLGYFTLVAAHLVGPAGSVRAFEPSPTIFPRLQANVRLNPKLNVRVYQAAVTDRRGQVTFYSAPADRSGYSSLRHLGGDVAGVATVAAVALDDLLAELPPTRLVKIDVEGAEWLVLQGMRRLLKRDRPYLICEIDDGFLRELGADADRVCRFLRDAGYDIYRIVERGALVPVAGAPTERCNLLAQPVAAGCPG